MIHIEPLGTGGILPAFVVGYELASTDGEWPVRKTLPSWVVAMHQQAGGLAMSYPSVIGAILRLEANTAHARKDLRRLIRGFRLMAEDPDLTTLQCEYPVLAGLVLTHGTSYTKRELHDLENILSAHVSAPPIQGGIEAFLRHERADPLEYFRGWQILRCALRQDGKHRGSIYSFPDSDEYHVDDSNLTDLDLADDVVYDENRQEELVALGAALKRTDLPGVFFLWENSD